MVRGRALARGVLRALSSIYGGVFLWGWLGLRAPSRVSVRALVMVMVMWSLSCLSTVIWFRFLANSGDFLWIRDSSDLSDLSCAVWCCCWRGRGFHCMGSGAFLIYPNLLKILSLKQFGRWLVIMHVPCLQVIIIHRFTCGERKIL